MTESVKARASAASSAASRRPGGHPVDDDHPVDPSLGPHHAQGGDDVVEDAEAAADVRKGVVRPAAEVRRDAVLERRACREDRCAGRAAGALDELGRPREPEPELLAPLEPTVAHALHPVRRVRPAEVVPPRGVGVVDVDVREAGGRLAHHPVLAERERCPAGSG